MPGGGRLKPRIVVLGGAGAMGRIAARDLLRSSRGALQVVVADRDVAPARDAATARNVASDRDVAADGASASKAGWDTVSVDVRDPASLHQALAGAFAVIASLPYRFNLVAMKGALRAGAHYIDLGGLFHMTRRQLAMAAQFERAGLMAILGMGSAPGIVNVLAVLAARDLDVVREVHCLVGSVDRTRFKSPPPLGFGYSIDTLLDEFVMPSAVFRRGAFASVPALDPRERLAVRFPAPLGRLQVDTTLHSEVATLPLHFAGRGIREVSFRQAFEPEFRERLAFLVKLGLADTDVLRPGALPDNGSGMSPRQVLLGLLARLPPAVLRGKPVRHEVLRALVIGRKGRRTVRVTADCHAGPRSGGGIGPDIDTGAPPSIAVQLMLAGTMEIRPGVWAPEQVIPVAPFVRALERRGMRVTCRTRT